MKVYYVDDEPTLSYQDSIFLAGPTPRSKDVKSWRPDALRILEDLEFEGRVFVPERRTGAKIDYMDQVEWEHRGLENVYLVVFWVPRDLETMPAFTTNVEFGRYATSGRIVYGRPPEAPKNRYLDWLYQKYNPGKEIHSTLQSLMEEAWYLIEKG